MANPATKARRSASIPPARTVPPSGLMVSVRAPPIGTEGLSAPPLVRGRLRPNTVAPSVANNLEPSGVTARSVTPVLATPGAWSHTTGDPSAPAGTAATASWPPAGSNPPT